MFRYGIRSCICFMLWERMGFFIEKGLVGLDKQAFFFGFCPLLSF